LIGPASAHGLDDDTGQVISGLKAVIVWYWLHKQYETGERKVLSLLISDQEGSKGLTCCHCTPQTVPSTSRGSIRKSRRYDI